MPTKKKKYNARFPPARIKKIMQSDEEVGKVAQVVPIIISKSLENFVKQLLASSADITKSRNARTLTTTHIKASIFNKPEFAFLRDLAQSIPDVSTNLEEEEDNCVNSASANSSTATVPVNPTPADSSEVIRTTKGQVIRVRRVNDNGNSAPPTGKPRGRPRKRPLVDDNSNTNTSKSQRNVLNLSVRDNHNSSSTSTTSTLNNKEDSDSDTELDEEGESNDDEDEDEADESNGLKTVALPSTSTISSSVNATTTTTEDDDYDNI